MKKLLLSVLTLLSISTLQANDFPKETLCCHNTCTPGKNGQPYFNDTIRNIITPNAHPLCFQSLSSGKPIAAYKTFVGFHEGPHFLHKGFYLNGVITTLVGNLSGDTLNVGEQIIRFFGINGLECGRCFSTCWSVENYQGKQFVVHYYGEFKVFTNNDTQFVIRY